MEGNMFCYQCQEAAKGTGCVLKGVCGKNSSTARYMDLLLFTVRGVSVAASALREQSVKVSAEVDSFVTDALFSTITNANFDDVSILVEGVHGLVRGESDCGRGSAGGKRGLAFAERTACLRSERYGGLSRTCHASGV